MDFPPLLPGRDRGGGVVGDKGQQMTDESLRAAEQAVIELEMLREFYACWEALHKIARNAVIAQRQKELAAQRLVDAAHSLRGFYEPVTPKLEVVK